MSEAKRCRECKHIRNEGWRGRWEWRCLAKGKVNPGQYACEPFFESKKKEPTND